MPRTLEPISIVTATDITLSDMPLAERIRAARLAAGLSQSELARRIKRNASAVNHMESGRSKALKSETVLALASALSVSAYWLETGLGSPTADARLSPEEGEVISLYRSMNASTRDAWLSVGRTLRDAQPGNKAGTANPYPTKKRTT